MSKTISEIKASKERLEDQMSCLMMKFEEENEVRISDLSIYQREICNENGKTIGRQIGTSIIVKL